MCIGEFGVVYRGTLTNWKDYFHHVVAVKTLKGVKLNVSSYALVAIIHIHRGFRNL